MSKATLKKILIAGTLALAPFACTGSENLQPRDAGRDIASEARGGSGGGGGTPAGSGGSGGLGGLGGLDGTGGSASGGSGGTVGTGGSGGDADAGTPLDAGGDACGADACCSTADRDFDGTPDCLDGCPDTTGKQAPLMCGCDVAEDDSDLDTVPDCIDVCDADPSKTLSAGVCGCGRSDTADLDQDGTVDCLDGCPKDATRTTAGACGCVSSATPPLCLAHRYTFDGAAGTTVVTDVVGGAAGNGSVVMASLAGNGTVNLAGVASNQYVQLPGGIVSSMGNSATFEAWATWTPVNTSQWQRIFDFGSSDQGPGVQGTGQTYLFLTPRGGTNTLRAAITLASNAGEDLVDAPSTFPASITAHVAVVVDGTAHTMSLYQNGVQLGAATLRPANSLSALNDVNNWLGRSQWVADQELAGTLHEFRMYSAALTPAQIAANAAAGPDNLPGAGPADAGTDDSGVAVDAGTDVPVAADAGVSEDAPAGQ